METTELKSDILIEALLFIENKPVSVLEISRLTKLDKKEVRKAIKDLKERYQRNGNALTIVEISNGYMFSVVPELFEKLRDIYIEKMKKRLSGSALETLAIVAYKQPITRTEIEDIRGVDSVNNIKILLERNLIRIVGRKKVIGHPLQYGTTKKFLVHFSLKNLNELPTLKEIRELEIE